MGTDRTAASSVTAIYRERQARFAVLESKALRQSNRLSNWRLGAFLTAIGLIVLATSAWRDQPIPLLVSFAAAVASLVAFVLLVLKQHKIDEQQLRYERLRLINEHGEHRRNRAWSEFPALQAPRAVQELTIARDLDVFGTGSLFHLLCTAPSTQGRNTLASWLTEPGQSEGLKERHASAQELAPLLDWRQQLQATGYELAEEDPNADPIRTWIGRDPWITPQPWLTKLAVGLPLALFSLILLKLTGAIHGPWWLLGLAVTWGFTRVYRSRMDAALHDLSQQEKPLRHYAKVFGQVQTLDAESPPLRRLKTNLEDAYQGMTQLSRLATQADSRGSIVHPLLQLLLLWDFHTVRSIEHWQKRHGQRVPIWFHALGELEALASLANLHHDEPDWVFPTTAIESNTFKGTQLGHPLIAQDVRVCNDVTLGPAGHFLLITGSNMSGKSTMLRSIGLNTILAQAGAPVCATALELSAFQLATSLQVQDSLAEGVSFFMAELKRIQQVVHLAEDIAKRANDSIQVLYLLDEILQGTNTEERQIIVQRVLAHLVCHGAVGAVTTHDLSLAEIDEFASARQLGHFREDFRETNDGPQMTFDYHLRPGVATSTNAVKLLEIIDLKI